MSIIFDKPLFSIICPVYNSEAYLEESIESVQNQTFDNWELILIDDGSTDDSAAIINKYLEHDFRIKYISQKNYGQFIARLNGIKRSNGKYIIFLDSDDTLNQNALQTLAKKIKEFPYDFIFFNANVITDKDNRPLLSKADLSKIKNDMVFETIVNGTTGWSCCKTFKKSVLDLDSLEKIGKQSFKLNHNEDLLFTCSCLNNLNSTILVLDCSLYNYFKSRSKILKSKVSQDYLQSLVFSLNYRYNLLDRYNIDSDSFNSANKGVAFFHLYSISGNKVMSNYEKREAISYLMSDRLYNELFVEWCNSKHSFKERIKKLKFMLWRNIHG